MFFARSVVVKKKSKMADVGLQEWIQRWIFIENLSNIDFIFCLLFLLPLIFDLFFSSYFEMCCGIPIQ